MEGKPLRVGIVGADASGQGWAPLSHLPALKLLPQFELAAVCTAHADTAAAAAAKYGVSRAFHDFSALVAQPDIDLVSVVVKVPSHRDVVAAALNAGKNVYCEWPLGANLGEAVELAGLAARKGTRAMIGLQARGDSTLRYLRELVADGELGDVLAVNMTMFTGGVLDRPQSRTWDRDKTKGVSALTVRGIHTMDAMCWCLGDFVEVSGKVTTQVKQWKITETGEMVDVDAADNVMVNGVLKSGAIASVHVGTVPFNASGWRMEIFGRKGTIRATSKGSPQRDANALLGAQNGGALEPLPVPPRFVEVPQAMPAGPPRNVGHLYLRMARAIRDGTAVAPDFEVALNRHRLIDAIQRSSDEGRAIALA
ncbi:MAG: Gfo/Idh/MocA family oxidoreductase [Casimicrobiaceae bacterium]